MKDFPLDNPLSFTDLDKVNQSPTLIFSHLIRKLPLPNPSSSHSLKQSHGTPMMSFLTSHRLAYTTFKRLLAQTTARGIFRTWGDLIKESTKVARKVMIIICYFLMPVPIVYTARRYQQRIIYRIRLVCVEDHTDPTTNVAYPSRGVMSVRATFTQNIVSTKRTTPAILGVPSGRLAE